MKKMLLISILCIFSQFIYAQWFDGISKDSVRIMCDTVLKLAKHEHVFLYVQEAKKSGDFEILVFRRVDNKQDIRFKFQMFNIGENLDLEIKGKPSYIFEELSDMSFLDIYPFWNKFIDPNSTVEDVLAKKRTNDNLKVLNGTRWRLWGVEDKWQLFSL